MKHILPFLTTLLLMAGCSTSPHKDNDCLPEIKVNQTPDKKEITFQEIAENISYIPLETNDSMLLRGVFLSICNEGITVMHQVDGQVFLFDGKGKARGSISRKGGGPEEYVGMQQAVVDWKRNELFVLDYKPYIKVYDLSGNYKRTLSMPIKVRDREMYSYSDSHLVLFKEVPDTEIGQADRDFAPYQPIILLEKTTGKTTTLPYTKTSNASIRLSSGWVNNNAIYASGKNIYLSDVSSDTIYQLHPSGHTIEPKIVRTPSVNSMDGERFLLNLEGSSNRYGFFRRTNKEIKGKAAQSMQEWMYDYQTGKTFQPIFKNQDAPSMKLDAHTLIHCHGEDNCLYVKLEAFELIEALENGELNGELQTIAQELVEDDNPVLMIVKL